MANSNQHSNLSWNHTSVTKDERQKLNQHKSMMIWFTGLSGAGKSTLANLVEKELFKQGIHTYLLDGDNLRFGINKNLGFSTEDRKENIRRTAEVGKLFVDAGVVVLAALISPFQTDRNKARELFNEGEFIEIHVKCSASECEKRDPKGLYKKARAGIIKDFTGIDHPYEEPSNPEIVVDTSIMSVKEALAKITDFLMKKI
jgi:adenylylsulfate kinase